MADLSIYDAQGNGKTRKEQLKVFCEELSLQPKAEEDELKNKLRLLKEKVLQHKEE